MDKSLEEMIDEVFSEKDMADNSGKRKPRVIILSGNIGCGKSTLVKKLMNMNDCVVINKDTIIESISGAYGRYDSNKKNIYDSAEYIIMTSALDQRYNVIVDRLNINKEQRSKFIEIAKRYTDDIVAYDFGAGTNEGLERRKKNNRGVPAKTWEKVWKTTKDSYEAPTKEEGFSKILKPPKKYTFYAFDFDNCLVKSNDLSIISLKKKTVSRIKNLYKNIENIIIIWTSRSGDLLNEATTYLIENGVPFDFVNENPLAGFETSNKIFAHYYIDDRNISIKDS